MASYVPGPNSGRLEAAIVFPTDQTVEITPDGGSLISTTIAGGVPWFMNDLLYELTSTSGCYFDMSGGPNVGGELGTGQVTAYIPPWNTPFSITWLTGEMMTALGFDNNWTSVSTLTGVTHARGVWLPGTLGKFSKHGDYDWGKLVTDFRQTIGPSGTVHALSSSSYRVHESIRWEGVPAQRAKEHHEVIKFESFESFFRDAALGRTNFIPVNARVRLYWNTQDDSTLSGPPNRFAEGHVLWPPAHDSEPTILGWTGRYTIALPPLVVES